MIQQYVLFGHPIERSPSPAMQQAAFDHAGIHARYTLHPAVVDDIQTLEQLLQTRTLAGANITTPLKRALLPLCRPQGIAARAQAVNTLVRTPHGYNGYLTDVTGVQKPLTDTGLAPHLKDAVILGAGGAAQAAALACENLMLRVHCAARDPAKAAAVLAALRPAARGWALCLADTAGMQRATAQCACLVQATPVGRQTQDAALPVPWAQVPPGCIAFEMLYLPVHTAFVRSALQHTLRVVYGWQMLVAQGAQSWSLWTGLRAPYAKMEAAVRQNLSG